MEEFQKEISLNILGSEWTLCLAHQEDHKYLLKADGFTDKTTKKMVVCFYPADDSELEDYEPYAKKIIRHEILHAYLFEAGLHENFMHPEYGHDETFLDFIAYQFPKIMKTYQEANAL